MSWLARPQLSTIIRVLSPYCRAAKIAGCRLRGQEIMAAAVTTSGRVGAIVRQCQDDVSKRF